MKNKPVFLSIIGKSDSGKTTLILKLLPELRNRGHKVAVAKHCPCGFDLDVKGKDSWKFTHAGSEGTYLSCEDSEAIIRPKESSLPLKDKLRNYFFDFDIVLMEGYTDESGINKMQIIRKGVGGDILTSQDVLAYISDLPLEVAKPIYDPNDISGILFFLEKQIGE